MTSKTKRSYQRISSGQYIAKLQNKKLRMATFTSKDYCTLEKFSRDLDTFIKRWRRRDATLQYWKINVFKNGRWHCHLVYKGKYVPKKWLVYNWNSIHNAYIVDICALDDRRNVASYVANQYLSNQEGEYTSMSYSQKWLFKGAIKLWKNICDICRNYKEKPIDHYGYLVFPIDIKLALRKWSCILWRYIHGLPLTLPDLVLTTLDGDFG
jgi:hypothetical protein